MRPFFYKTIQILGICMAFNMQSFSQTVGAISGQPMVDASGAFTYNIPLTIPPGVRSMMPQLAISYNSLSDNGLLGKGWTITGLSSITRTTKNIAHDLDVKPVDFNNDVYQLDGQRLLPVGGNTYLTEIKNFSTIQSSGTAGNGPERFRVETKEGMVYEYGYTTDSRMLAQNRNDVWIWALNRVYDKCGNYIDFTYFNNQAWGEYHIASIQYTGNLTNNTTPSTKIIFDYAYKSDKNFSWIAGARLQDVWRLSDIQVLQSNIQVHRYDFMYTTNFYSHLTQVKETGENGSTLPATSVNWGATASPSSLTTTSLIGGNNNAYGTGDFNGDGYTDCINYPRYNPNPINFSTFNAYLNNHSDNFNGTPISGTFIAFQNSVSANTLSSNDTKMALDYNGDGYDDYIVITYDNTNIKVYLYKSTGTGFAAPETLVSGTGSFTTPQFAVGDFLGNGKKQLFLAIISASTIHIYQYMLIGDGLTNNNNGFPTVVQFAPDEVSNLHAVDFDGDGRDEIFKTLTVSGQSHSVIDKMNISYDQQEQPYVANQQLVFTNIFAAGYPTAFHDIFFGDFNGDGKTDLLTHANIGVWEFAYSTGVGLSVVASTAGFQNAHPSATDDNNNFIIADYNGDGKSDILEMYHGPTNSNYNYFKVYYSQGNNNFLVDVNTISTSSIGDIYTSKYNVGDFNGDGQNDLMYLRTINSPIQLLYFHKNEQRDLVQSIYKNDNQNPGNGQRYFVTYSPLPQYSGYTLNNAPTYPYNRAIPGLKVTTTFRDYRNINTSYEYKNLAVHRTGLGARGFQQFISKDITNNRMVIEDYDQIHFNTPVLSSTKLVNSTNPNNYNTIIQTQPSFAQIGINTNTHAKSYVIYPVSTTEDDYKNSTHSFTNYTYYSTGPGSSLYKWGLVDEVKVNVGNGQEITTTKYQYSANNANVYNQCKPQKIITEIQRANKPVYTRNMVYGYNAQGLPGISAIDDGTPHQDAYSTSFDAFGNPKVVTHLADYTTKQFVYTADGRFVSKTVNELGHTEKYAYDLWGSVVKYTDQNNLTTTRTYDNFNRIIKAVSPTGKTMNTEYLWAGTQASCPSGQLYPRLAIRYTVNGIQGGQISYYDVYGRKIRDVNNGYSGQLVYTDTKYLANGNIERESLPYFSQNVPIYTTYTYDNYDREISRIKQQSATFYTSYQPLTNPTAAGMKMTLNNATSGQSKLVEMDATAKPIKVTENGTTLEYDYNSNGNPDKIKVNNTNNLTTTYTYDAFGNQLSETGPNIGTSTSEYNYRNWLITHTDANGNSYKYGYDALGRVIKKIGSEGTYTYNYDAGTAAIGHLSSMLAPPFASAKVFTYDAMSRLSAITESFFLVSNTTKYTYDIYDREVRHQYPSGDIVVNEYNSYGHFKGVSFPGGPLTPGESIYSIKTKNAYGQTTQGDYRTSIIFNVPPLLSVYNTYSGIGALQNSKLSKNPSQVLSNFNYNFNAATGNLSSRKDIMRNLTENFTYDNLDRLTLTDPSNNVPNVTMGYTADGTMNKKSDVSAYNWQNDRYAVKVIPAHTAVIPSFTQPVEYYPFEKIKNVTENNKQATFLYYPDGSRAITNYATNNVTTKLKLYATDYERTYITNPQQVCYVRAEGKIVAMITRNQNNQRKVHYVHDDHLGSITHIVNEQGVLEEERSFDAWGRYRNAQNWSYNVIPIYNFDRGYTGHEHLQDFNIINMNGRLYDPLIGKMFNPDPIVSDKTSAQGFNKYSYVLNNPLKYTDPSGNFILEICSAWPFLSDQGYEFQKFFSPIALKSDFHIGSHQKGMGFDVSVGLPKAATGYRWDYGSTYYWKNDGADKGWETRKGGEATICMGWSFTGMTYKSGGHEQTTNTMTVGDAFNQMSYENETVMPLAEYFSGVFCNQMPVYDGGDRWRTAAARIRVGMVDVGMNLHTGMAGGNGYDERTGTVRPDSKEFTGGDIDDPSKRQGILYFGVGPLRVGMDTEGIRHFFQNRMVHDHFFKYYGGQEYPWVAKVNKKNRFYWYYGSGTGSSLW